MQDSRRNEVENVLDTVDHYGMSGIVSPLRSSNYVKLLREKVNDLPFSFISPLRTDDDYVWHDDFAPSPYRRVCPQAKKRAKEGSKLSCPPSFALKVNASSCLAYLQLSINQPRNVVFRGGSNDLLLQFAVLEQKQRRDTPYVVTA